LAEVKDLCETVGTMKNTLTVPDTTRLEAFIKEMMPWAHGHQIKAIAAFAAAIIAKQTGC
jgi:hypothetical protein